MEIKSFKIISCNRADDGNSIFSIVEVNGILKEGDRFSCRSAWKLEHFKVVSIINKKDEKLIICEGNVNFRDEFIGHNLNTIPYPERRDDLPEPPVGLVPSETEYKNLNRYVPDFEYLHPFQKALCLCLWRGYGKYEELAEMLGVNQDIVKSARRGISGLQTELEDGCEVIFIRG